MMRRISPLFFALSAVAGGLPAQTVPTAERARPAETALPSAAGPARVAPTGGCELATESGLRLAFGRCEKGSPAGSARAKEVEVVEYRNGDSPVAASVQLGGAARPDFAVLQIAALDPDDDADGVPDAARATRRPAGRMKVGRITLRGRGDAGTKSLLALRDGDDADGAGFPVTVMLRSPGGGEARIELGGCTPAEPEAAAGAARGAIPAGRRTEITLDCARVRMVAALDANPYARFIAGSQDGRAGAGALYETRAARRGESARRLRLEDTILRAWSLELDPGAARGTGRWTLEVRVNRIEMA
ncbi:MAG: hypothetical protein R6X22_10610 [Gemmatimonadota bacterium]